MTGRPLLFLDVDGVLNRFALQNVPPVDGEHWMRRVVDHPGMGRSMPLVMDPADAARIRSMADVADVVWGSTWNELANAAVAPLIVLHALPVAPMHRRFSEYDETAAWKWQHVTDYANGRPFAWIDDGFTPQMTGMAQRRTQRGEYTMLITAHPAVGLTDGMVDDVREFADMVARKTGSGPPP